MSRTKQLFSPKQVAEALDVSESSIKRWCDRGLIETVRTAGGHRRIPLAGLNAFLARDSRTLSKPSVLGLAEERADPVLAAFASGAIEAPGETMTRFERALSEGDVESCRQLLHLELSRTGSIATVGDSLIAPTLMRFGEQWDCGDLNVYQERRGCEICQQLLVELEPSSLIPSTLPGPIAIGAAPSGDPYRLPTKLVEMTLRENNWNATSLGSELPLTSLADAVRDMQPRLVWLSVSSITNEAEFVSEYQEFSERVPNETIIVIGGRALGDEIRPQLRYTAHCDNLTALAHLAKTLARPGHSLGVSDN